MRANRNSIKSGCEDACPKCGSSNRDVKIFSDAVEFRNLELDVEGLEESKCRNCGAIYCTASQEAQNAVLTKEAYVRQRDQLRRNNGLLSGDEIARIRELLHLGQREAASLFGGGYNAFNKYESGEVLQSFAMDRLLRLAKVIGKPVVQFLKNVEAPPPFFVTASAGSSRGIVYSVPGIYPAGIAGAAYKEAKAQDSAVMVFLGTAIKERIYLERAA